MQICLLASGSKGNAIYVETAESRLLIDAGLSAREIGNRLNAIGKSPEQLDALLVTHEHGDHCRGLGPVSRRWKLPVHIHHATREALPHAGKLTQTIAFDSGDTFCLRDLIVHTVPVTHDAAAPTGFILETSSGKIGIATDLGLATRLVIDRFQGCRVLVLESNHDEDLLRDGPYPWHLKQRIRSRHGHLSNRESAELLRSLAWPGLEAVLLAHLSEANNTPQLAEDCARKALNDIKAFSTQLFVGCQDRPSICFGC
ncbi:MAG: MBL fold metallo-hydrolase [Syntrophotalea acetylenica]|uniref:MBL fold metallo-hydrolase n=1 Tax=Syntrophotalea acetylenica TaxID=29542 RepID=A0A1L3GHX9_SYNAC|nr:MBL fold metallo-hydrolase [Syntrophotalea acetylenica]APG25553.1 MBL fold metallo-hydrolase [Syntrophotalea acetylenica]APG43620.1 MBL fold metallo-hydrolase [Syntrophotalea acetylenica]MDD4457349.1 MBL fold metallo-hydrolase [Syntrophotalea acetylenica]MDY0262129.1 MBL fold metallo-hydrolase [Syntrophotalea acetylenica]